MPTVVHPMSGIASDPESQEAARGAASKVANHRDPDEKEEEGGCCQVVSEQGGVGSDRQQNDIDRMWNKNAALFSDEDNPVDFRDLMNIKFAEDSGFEDVPKLWVDGQTMKMRVFHATLAIIFVVYNTRFVLLSDFAAVSASLHEGEHEPFLVAKVFWDAIIDTFFPNHRFKDLAHNHILIGYMELAGLVWLYLQAISVFAVIYLPKAVPRFWFMSQEQYETQQSRDQWLACSTLYTNILPQISCYSGMRLLSYVQPHSLATDINDWKRASRSCLMSIIVWAYFIATRVFCVVVGFDMFLTKFRVAKVQGVFAMEQNDEFSWGRVLTSFLFMRQVLGVLKVDILVRQRLYIFIFGGPDSMMSPHDKAVQMVWEALTVRRIHRKTEQQYGTVRGFIGFVSVLLTFSDEDFQRLTLDPKRE